MGGKKRRRKRKRRRRKEKEKEEQEQQEEEEEEEKKKKKKKNVQSVVNLIPLRPTDGRESVQTFLSVQHVPRICSQIQLHTFR